MGNHIENNYYIASHLLSDGFILDHVDEDKNKRIRYHFNDNELLQKAITEFNENQVLQSFIKGMIETKKIIKKHNQMKRTPRLDKKAPAKTDNEKIIDEII